MGKIYLTEDQLRGISWTHHDSELVHDDVRPARFETDSELGEIEVDRPVSQAFGFSELCGATPDGHEITLTLDWAASGDINGHFADLYDWDTPETNPQGGEGPHIQPDIVILDADGDECLPREVSNILDDIVSETEDLWQPHAKETLPEAPTPEKIDYDEDSNMTEYEVERDNAPAIKFNGEVLAEASSHEIQGPRNTRWTVLRLYKTKGGRYICEQIGRTIWQGERDLHSAAICDNMEQVIDFFGHGWLAKHIYHDAEIDAAEFVD